MMRFWDGDGGRSNVRRSAERRVGEERGGSLVD